MSTLIHILGKSGPAYSCAFYYPVPDNIYDPSSVDDARIPASDKLTQAEIDDVKLGHIYEVLVGIDGQGKEEADVKELISITYTDNTESALDGYVAAYSSYVGETWDGTTWV